MQNLLNTAKKVIQIQTQELHKLEYKLDETFVQACVLIKQCTGKVVLMGMGKSGHIANKIAATLASTGTPSFFVHPAEAGHGDFGMISSNDIVIAISYSGNSDEIIRLIPLIKRLGVPLISFTGNKNSPMATQSSLHLDVSVDKEACPHNLAPTSSTTIALVMGDALAISLLEDKGFSAQDFARTHPSGALGRRLLTSIADIMCQGDDLPIVTRGTLLIPALLVMSQKKLGLLIIADNYQVLGVFTDGDLRRILQHNKNIQHLRIDEIMQHNYQTIHANKPAISAVEIMDRYKISSIPVLDENNKLVGAINTHSLLNAKII